MSDLVLERFKWVDGHADLWPLFRDGKSLKAVIEDLVAPFRGAGVTAVCGIESRGFLLGGAAAVELGVGFVPVRKAGGVFAGEKLTRETEPDYRGIKQILRMQRASLTSNDRVLLVDDWIETGSQAAAVQAMVEQSGATLTGIAVIVDELGNRPGLAKVHSLVSGNELPGE